MIKYKTIDELDARIERIISGTVKAYYTDWKNYDRPKYMRFKGSNDRKDKECILIVRKYGTYLIRIEDIKTGDNWANTLYEYFQTQENGDYYYINIYTMELKKIDPEIYGKELKKSA